MKLVKYLIFLLLAVIGLFLFVANFSSVASSYECKGEVAVGGSKVAKTVYIVHEEYRWWVGLWGDSAGNIKLEIPNEYAGYYGHIVEVGSQRQIYDSPNELKGNFSTLSKVLALQTPYGFFDGKCLTIH